MPDARVDLQVAQLRQVGEQAQVDVDRSQGLVAAADLHAERPEVAQPRPLDRLDQRLHRRPREPEAVVAEPEVLEPRRQRERRRDADVAQVLQAEPLQRRQGAEWGEVEIAAAGDVQGVELHPGEGSEVDARDRLELELAQVREREERPQAFGGGARQPRDPQIAHGLARRPDSLQLPEIV